MCGEKVISKKELLKLCNISYGQLYRWKREGLIPDEWFIKQSVSTGQETFFNREDIIPRIKTIIELKDKYQLEEIKKFLNPKIDEREFFIKDIIAIDEIDPFIAKKYMNNKKSLSIFDVVLIYLFSVNQDVLNFDDYLDYDFSEIKSLDMYFYILLMENKYYILITNKESIIDHTIKIYKKVKLSSISAIIAKKLGGKNE
ncbi:MAG TPA: DUF4004 family protein [Acholeplasmataceae bacterium]|nr:DUF4004 family protein [Acholeplasmataceae bacterium]